MTHPMTHLHGATAPRQSARKDIHIMSLTLAPRCSGRTVALGVALLATLAAAPAAAQKKLDIVTTLTTYASITREVTGDLANVRSIARGDVDPHFVAARPSFAGMMRNADMLVSTGLDLELWLPGLLDRANNPKIREGSPGHVVAYAGIRLLQVPTNVSRSGGDVHVFGNPHIHTDPINAIIIARNVAAGLKRIDPGHADTYDRNLADFENRITHRLFGDRLVEMLGGETLVQLAMGTEFWSFLEGQSLDGHPLTYYLGGWLAQAAPFRDQRMICYHKEWAYFSARFKVECSMYIEPKPGIPPSPGHVREVMDFIRANHIPVLLAANFFSRSQVERVAQRTGATAVIVPMHEGGEDGVDDYFTLVDTWISRLSAAFQQHGS